MLRLRDVSHRTKLNALVIGYTVLVTGALAASVYLLLIYRVHGPVYTEIVDDIRLQHDLDPAVMNLGAAYLQIQEIDSLTDPTEIRETIEKYREYEAKFFDRRAYWMPKLPEGEIKRILETQANPAAVEFLRIAREEYLPLVTKGPEARKKANEILNTKLRPKFWEQ